MCNGKLPCTRSSGEDFKIKLIFQDGLLQGVSNLNRPLPTCSRGCFVQIMLRSLYIDLSPFTRYGRESSINTIRFVQAASFLTIIIIIILNYISQRFILVSCTYPFVHNIIIQPFVISFWRE